VSLQARVVDVANGSVAVTAMTGGTTEPDFTTAFETIEGREYDYILPALSNADAASASGNVARLETHINGFNEGLNAHLQQGVVGHTGSRTAAAVSSVARNEQVIELLCAQQSESLPCEVAGDEMGDRMKQRALYISRNRIGTSMQIAAAADPVANNPTVAQSDAALLAGLSIAAYNERGEPYLVRAVTTYSQTDTGTQVLPTDCNEIDALYDYAKDLRAFLPVEFANARVTRDITEPSDDLPEGVVEERDIKAAIVARTRSFWIPKGVLNGDHFNEKLASGELVVRVNDTDETQVDIFIPAKPFKNLAKLGVYVAKDG
jgi:phage tail sheath gpL-like